MSRALTIRVQGLYKKANTLFNMLHPKVSIIVHPEGGVPQAYASHSAAEWPELHALLGSMGLQSWDVLGPDHFDTIADRLEYSSRSSSAGSAKAPDDAEIDRLMLMAGYAEPSSNQAESCPDNVSMPGSVVEPRPSPQFEMFPPEFPNERPDSRSRTVGETDTSSLWNSDGMGSIVRKRKSSGDGEVESKKRDGGRRRKTMVTRSQGDAHVPYQRQMRG